MTTDPPTVDARAAARAAAIAAAPPPPAVGPARPARDKLLAAAVRLLARDGAHGPSLDAIRVEAGVSVGALYHHFRERSALVAAVRLQLLGEYQWRLLRLLDDGPSAEEGIRGGVHLHLAWCRDQPEGARVLVDGGGGGDRPDDALRDANRAFFATVLGWWHGHVAAGALPDLPLDLAWATWLGPATELVRLRLAERPSPAPPRIDAAVAEQLASAAWGGLRALARPVPTDPETAP
ncbi:TetR/AcrR family transcriptional regulator [Patulibacter defluvii]|uniref:TetR/AcrR family transcriptional regulator n=1 Tax=Patulibacter defluvii TaxID=3095358 RepID=UPI002A7487CB|nr:TetR/AcrR family transcriptional regulator [Patulibacter sp. DM4]